MKSAGSRSATLAGVPPGPGAEGRPFPPLAGSFAPDTVDNRPTGVSSEDGGV